MSDFNQGLDDDEALRLAIQLSLQTSPPHLDNSSTNQPVCRSQSSAPPPRPTPIPHPPTLSAPQPPSQPKPTQRLTLADIAAQRAAVYEAKRQQQGLTVTSSTTPIASQTTVNAPRSQQLPPSRLLDPFPASKPPHLPSQLHQTPRTQQIQHYLPNSPLFCETALTTPAFFMHRLAPELCSNPTLTQDSATAAATAATARSNTFFSPSISSSNQLPDAPLPSISAAKLLSPDNCFLTTSYSSLIVPNTTRAIFFTCCLGAQWFCSQFSALKSTSNTNTNNTSAQQQTCKQIDIVVPHIDTADTMLIFNAFPNTLVNFYAPKMPQDWGTHHPKLILLFHPNGIRVIISTSNLEQQEASFKQQSVFHQDFPHSSVLPRLCKIPLPQSSFSFEEVTQAVGSVNNASYTMGNNDSKWVNTFYSARFDPASPVKTQHKSSSTSSSPSSSTTTTTERSLTQIFSTLSNNISSTIQLASACVQSLYGLDQLTTSPSQSLVQLSDDFSSADDFSSTIDANNPSLTPSSLTSPSQLPQLLTQHPQQCLRFWISALLQHLNHHLTLQLQSAYHLSLNKFEHHLHTFVTLIETRCKQGQCVSNNVKFHPNLLQTPSPFTSSSTINTTTATTTTTTARRYCLGSELLQNYDFSTAIPALVTTVPYSSCTFDNTQLRIRHLLYALATGHAQIDPLDSSEFSPFSQHSNQFSQSTPTHPSQSLQSSMQQQQQQQQQHTSSTSPNPHNSSLQLFSNHFTQGTGRSRTLLQQSDDKLFSLIYLTYTQLLKSLLNSPPNVPHSRQLFEGYIRLLDSVYHYNPLLHPLPTFPVLSVSSIGKLRTPMIKSLLYSFHQPLSIQLLQYLLVQPQIMTYLHIQSKSDLIVTKHAQFATTPHSTLPLHLKNIATHLNTSAQAKVKAVATAATQSSSSSPHSLSYQPRMPLHILWPSQELVANSIIGNDAGIWLLLQESNITTSLWSVFSKYQPHPMRHNITPHQKSMTQLMDLFPSHLINGFNSRINGPAQHGQPQQMIKKSFGSDPIPSSQTTPIAQGLTPGDTAAHSSQSHKDLHQRLLLAKSPHLQQQPSHSQSNRFTSPQQSTQSNTSTLSSTAMQQAGKQYDIDPHFYTFFNSAGVNTFSAAVMSAMSQHVQEIKNGGNRLNTTDNQSNSTTPSFSQLKSILPPTNPLPPLHTRYISSEQPLYPQLTQLSQILTFVNAEIARVFPPTTSPQSTHPSYADPTQTQAPQGGLVLHTPLPWVVMCSQNLSQSAIGVVKPMSGQNISFVHEINLSPHIKPVSSRNSETKGGEAPMAIHYYHRFKQSTTLHDALGVLGKVQYSTSSSSSTIVDLSNDFDGFDGDSACSSSSHQQTRQAVNSTPIPIITQPNAVEISSLCRDSVQYICDISYSLSLDRFASETSSTPNKRPPAAAKNEKQRSFDQAFLNKALKRMPLLFSFLSLFGPHRVSPPSSTKQHNHEEPHFWEMKTFLRNTPSTTPITSALTATPSNHLQNAALSQLIYAWLHCDEPLVQSTLFSALGIGASLLNYAIPIQYLPIIHPQISTALLNVSTFQSHQHELTPNSTPYTNLIYPLLSAQFVLTQQHFEIGTLFHPKLFQSLLYLASRAPSCISIAQIEFNLVNERLTRPTPSIDALLTSSSSSSSSLSRLNSTSMTNLSPTNSLHAQPVQSYHDLLINPQTWWRGHISSQFDSSLFTSLHNAIEPVFAQFPQNSFPFSLLTAFITRTLTSSSSQQRPCISPLCGFGAGNDVELCKDVVVSFIQPKMSSIQSNSIASTFFHPYSLDSHSSLFYLFGKQPQTLAASTQTPVQQAQAQIRSILSHPPSLTHYLSALATLPYLSTLSTLPSSTSPTHNITKINDKTVPISPPSFDRLNRLHITQLCPLPYSLSPQRYIESPLFPQLFPADGGQPSNDNIVAINQLEQTTQSRMPKNTSPWVSRPYQQ